MQNPILNDFSPPLLRLMPRFRSDCSVKAKRCHIQSVSVFGFTAKICNTRARICRNPTRSLGFSEFLSLNIQWICNYDGALLRRSENYSFSNAVFVRPQAIGEGAAD